MNGNVPRRFGVLYLGWKLCGRNSTALPYRWRRNRVILAVSDLEFLIFFNLIVLHVLDIVNVESSVPGLFSTSASPKRKGPVGISKVKIQLKHTDTSELS